MINVYYFVCDDHACHVVEELIFEEAPETSVTASDSVVPGNLLMFHWIGFTKVGDMGKLIQIKEASLLKSE